MVYDHDTMRVAAASTGAFVDWKGIAFDGSHGTHTSLTGERHFINAGGLGYSTGGPFTDPRPKGKDGKPYGPGPAAFKGLYKHGNKTVLAIGTNGTIALESPSWIDYGSTPIFVRTINISSVITSHYVRIAPESMNVVVQGDGKLIKEAGDWVLEMRNDIREVKARVFLSKCDPGSLATLAANYKEPLDLTPLTKGGPAQWPQTSPRPPQLAKTMPRSSPMTSRCRIENPFQSWMRPGGFDFTPDGKAAIVAMWNGDVWRVDGVMAKAPETLTWRRIASGLFQPLGVKYFGDELYVLCRDQLAKLVDLNADGETDFIECFNRRRIRLPSTSMSSRWACRLMVRATFTMPSPVVTPWTAWCRSTARC
jgi:hypothetical protein